MLVAIRLRCGFGRWWEHHSGTMTGVAGNSNRVLAVWSLRNRWHEAFLGTARDMKFVRLQDPSNEPFGFMVVDHAQR